jgi:hypothetical protein
MKSSVRVFGPEVMHDTCNLFLNDSAGGWPPLRYQSVPCLMPGRLIPQLSMRATRLTQFHLIIHNPNQHGFKSRVMCGHG